LRNEILQTPDNLKYTRREIITFLEKSRNWSLTEKRVNKSLKYFKSHHSDNTQEDDSFSSRNPKFSHRGSMKIIRKMTAPIGFKMIKTGKKISRKLSNRSSESSDKRLTKALSISRPSSNEKFSKKKHSKIPAVIFTDFLTDRSVDLEILTTATTRNNLTRIDEVNTDVITLGETEINTPLSMPEIFMLPKKSDEGVNMIDDKEKTSREKIGSDEEQSDGEDNYTLGKTDINTPLNTPKLLELAKKSYEVVNTIDEEKIKREPSPIEKSGRHENQSEDENNDKLEQAEENLSLSSSISTLEKSMSNYNNKGATVSMEENNQEQLEMNDNFDILHKEVLVGNDQEYKEVEQVGEKSLEPLSLTPENEISSYNTYKCMNAIKFLERCFGGVKSPNTFSKNYRLEVSLDVNSPLINHQENKSFFIFC